MARLCDSLCSASRALLAGGAVMMVLALPAPGFEGAVEPLPPERLERAEQLVTQALEELRIPGAALAVVQDGRPVLLRAWGMTGGSERPMSVDTPFTIGSNSKALTAYGLMCLVEEGKVELDAPLRRYLPEFRLADPEASESITVRQLLAHRSGLSAESGYRIADRGLQDAGAIQSLLGELSKELPTAEAGEKYQYSAANYLLLGAVMERVSDRTFAAYMTTAVFEPLSMGQASADAVRAKEQGWEPGYRSWFGHPVASSVPYDTSGAPYGYMAASAVDMAHFLAALQDPSLGPLSDAAREAYLAPIVFGEGQADYGFGWRFGKSRTGETRIWHGGATADFRSEVFLLKESGIGVALLTNRNNALEAETLKRLAGALEATLLGVEAPGVEAPPVPLRRYGLMVVAALVAALLILAWRVKRVRGGGGWRTGRGLVGGFGLVGGACLIPGVLHWLSLPSHTLRLMVPDLWWLLIFCSALLLSIGLLGSISSMQGSGKETLPGLRGFHRRSGQRR